MTVTNLIKPKAAAKRLPSVVTVVVTHFDIVMVKAIVATLLCLGMAHNALVSSQTCHKILAPIFLARLMGS